MDGRLPRYVDAMASALRPLTSLILFSLLILVSNACSAPGLAGTLVVESSSLPEGGDLHGQTVSGEVVVSFEQESEHAVDRVLFQLNGVDPARPPWRALDGREHAIRLDSAMLFDGTHRLSVVAFDDNGDRIPGSVHATFRTANRGTEHEARMPRAEGFTLRGDGAFGRHLLDREMRVWYERLWRAIEDNPDAGASSGDLRDYGYTFQQHMAHLITALRATGDLRFADEIARLADMIAERLTTKWYDAQSDTWIEPDDGTAGYRRLLLLRSSAGEDSGKDTQVLSSVLTHGMLASMAYVFEANRGQPSPAGTDFGAKADFWTDYLKNDFERIWRIRTGATWPEFPLWNHQVSHAWKSQMRWAFYMYKLTGLEPYLESARAYADHVLTYTFAVETPSGTGVVWSHVLSKPDYGLQPIAYARYDWAIEADIAWEGGLTGIDEDYMRYHARTIAHFVLDNGAEDLSFDVGGMKARSGRSLEGGTHATLPTRDPWDDSGLAYGRESFNRFMISYVTPVAAFAETDRIASIAVEAYEYKEEDRSDPDALAVPAGMLMVESVRR